MARLFLHPCSLPSLPIPARAPIPCSHQLHSLAIIKPLHRPTSRTCHSRLASLQQAVAIRPAAPICRIQGKWGMGTPRICHTASIKGHMMLLEALILPQAKPAVKQATTKITARPNQVSPAKASRLATRFQPLNCIVAVRFSLQQMRI